MAETTQTPKPRKPRAKKEVNTEDKSVLSDVETEIEAVAGEVKADVEKELDKVDSDVAPLLEKLKDKTVDELKDLHTQAVYAEDAAKRELYVLRQRAANMATDVDASVEADIVEMKTKIAEAAAWLKALEIKLAGEVKDIWGTTF